MRFAYFRPRTDGSLPFHRRNLQLGPPGPALRMPRDSAAARARCRAGPRHADPVRRPRREAAQRGEQARPVGQPIATLSLGELAKCLSTPVHNVSRNRHLTLEIIVGRLDLNSARAGLDDNFLTLSEPAFGKKLAGNHDARRIADADQFCLFVHTNVITPKLWIFNPAASWHGSKPRPIPSPEWPISSPPQLRPRPTITTRPRSRSSKASSRSAAAPACTSAAPTSARSTTSPPRSSTTAWTRRSPASPRASRSSSAAATG